MTGTIAANPWAILEENPGVITGARSTTLKRLEESGVKAAVICSGHFALKQIELLRDSRAAWETRANVVKLVTRVGADLPDSPIAPDHGGLFEMSLLSVLAPEMLEMAELPSIKDHPGDAPGQPSTGPSAATGRTRSLALWAPTRVRSTWHRRRTLPPG